jgi:hypothetical protein
MSVSIKDSQRILNVGVVGCGEVAQIVHVRLVTCHLHFHICDEDKDDEAY